MPKRERKKDKKKKKKLTDKEILKLLKALKPKTQQIVRVNVGDREKKKKEEIQSSYNPPFVFPSQGFPSIINLGQAPAPQVPVPQAPVPRIQVPVPPPPQLRRDVSLLTDVETEAENVVVKRRSKKREEQERQGYTVSEPRFRKPKQINQAQLAAETVIPTKITDLPSMNDKFISFDIETNQGSDQMGNVATPFTSEEWTLSPDGYVMSVEEMQQQNITKPPPPPPVEETFEETFNVDEETLPPPPVDIVPTKEEMAKGKQIKSKFLKPKKNQIITDLSIAIEKGEIDRNELPAEFFNKKGGAVGKLKETLTLSALQPYWEELYVKRAGLGMGTTS